MSFFHFRGLASHMFFADLLNKIKKWMIVRTISLKIAHTIDGAVLQDPLGRFLSIRKITGFVSSDFFFYKQYKTVSGKKKRINIKI